MISPHKVFGGVKRGKPFAFPGADGAEEPGFVLLDQPAGSFSASFLQVFEYDGGRAIGDTIQRALSVIDGDHPLVQSIVGGVPGLRTAAAGVRQVAAGLANILTGAGTDLLGEWPLAFLEHELTLVGTRRIMKTTDAVELHLELRVQAVEPEAPAEDPPAETKPAAKKPAAKKPAAKRVTDSPQA